MLIRYAELDAYGYVEAISMLSGEVSAPYMIRLGDSEEVELGMKRVGGAWEPDDRPAPAPGPDLPAEIDKLKAENDTLRQEIASTNADAVSFQEFIFASFPELA